MEPEEAQRILAERPTNPTAMPDPELPPDTPLWARLQAVSGGLWGGCVYDPDAIIDALGDTGRGAVSGVQPGPTPTRQ